jgi:hypothetical protein
MTLFKKEAQLHATPRAWYDSTKKRNPGRKQPLALVPFNSDELI